MSRDIRINLIAKDDVSGRLEVISTNAEKTGDSLQRAGTDGAKGMEQVSDAAQRTSESLDRSAVAAGAFGATLLSALVVPIGMGTKAAWDQVDAVEQATLALRAYERDTRKVESALADMLAFARSDPGRLFMRQELFAFAQQLRVAGVETERLAEYTEIASRSVATGMGNWDELARVISRVGQTSRLAGIDFEMLQKMGFQLDQDLRNQTVTWEQLFDALDRGSVTVQGATDTIQGQLMMFRTELRGLGLDLLQVNSETSEFAEGGLGSVLYNSIERSRNMVATLGPVAENAGRALAFLAGGAALAVDGFLALPQGIQTTIFTIVGGFGALTVGASAIVLAFSKMSQAGSALRTTFISLGNTIRAHPILFIASIVGGLALSAWAKHRSEVEKAKAAYEDLESSIASVNDIIRSARLSGDFITAFRMEALVNTTRAGVDMWTNELNRGYEAWGDFVTSLYDDHDAARAFIDSDFFTAVVDQYQAMSGVGQEIIDEMLAGNISVIEAHIPGLREAMEQYYLSYLPSQGDRAAVEQEMEGLFELLQSEFIDSGEVMAEWNRLYHKYVINAERPNFQGFIAEWQEYSAGVVESAGEIIRTLDGLTEAQRDFRLEMLQMRLDGDGAMADDLESIRWLIGDIGQLSEEGAAYVEFFIKNIQSGNLALSDYSDELFVIQQMYRNGIIDQQEYERQLMLLTVRAAEAEIALRDLVNELHGVGSGMNRLAADTLGAEIAIRNLTDAAMVGVESGLDAYAEAHNERMERVIENLNQMIDLAGYGDPLSRWNLEGNAAKLSLLAMNAQHAASGLDSIFRVVVGNTNAIGSQFEQIFNWADELIAEEGVWSKLDELLDAGRIEGKHGVFTGDSDYALAQQAFNSIAEDNLRVQEAILTIQAKQAPYIAEQANAYADLMDEISRMPAEQQLVVLGWMDQATAMKAVELQTLAVKAANGELGAEGQKTFEAMLNGILATSPELRAMASDWGWLIENSDGTFTVDWSSVTEGKSEIATLIDSINELIRVLGEIHDVEVSVDLVDNASGPLDGILQTIAHLDGRRAVTYVETIFSSQGQRTQQHGGTLPGYAMGGVLFRGAEIGPELAHFAGGGTALLPRDGLYSAPAGTYISPNNAISNTYGGDIHVHVNGPVFGVPDLVAQISEELVPVISDVFEERTRGMGV